MSSNTSPEEKGGQIQQPQYIIARSPKSLGLALILTLVLGPIGLLYATVSGGIIMIVVDTIFAVVGLLTLGFSLFVTIPIVNFICMIWAYVKVKKYNQDLLSGNLNIQRLRNG